MRAPASVRRLVATDAECTFDGGTVTVRITATGPDGQPETFDLVMPAAAARWLGVELAHFPDWAEARRQGITQLMPRSPQGAPRRS